MVNFKHIAIFALCGILCIIFAACRRDAIKLPKDGFVLYVNSKKDCYDCIRDGINRLNGLTDSIQILDQEVDHRFLSYVREDFKQIKFTIQKSEGKTFPTPSIIFMKHDRPVFVLFLEYSIHERMKAFGLIEKLITNHW
jgi:hypothetical protein